MAGFALTFLIAVLFLSISSISTLLTLLLNYCGQSLHVKMPHMVNNFVAFLQQVLCKSDLSD